MANMRALWEHTPSLAQQIDRVDESELVECEQSRAGLVTCRLADQQGRSVYLHSRYDPAREAARWADGAEALAGQQREERSGAVAMCYFVDGFGLGYHVQALFDRLAGDAFIVVSEPNVPLIRTALEHIDYSEMIGSGRVIFITRADRQEIFTQLGRHSKEMMMGVVFTRGLHGTDSEHHSTVHRLVSEYASYLRSHTISLLANGIATCKNVLFNLPTYVATPGVGTLKGRFAGYPAVVVSAGPSLRKNIEQLKRIQDQVVVIAVQTTLKPLLEYGIKPDFVTSLDYHEVSRRFIEQLDARTDVHLIAEPKVNWQVVDCYRGRGPISLLGNEFARLVLGVTDDGHVELPPGATVAHLAFYLGEYIGADPIIFVGQDLAFSDNIYYSPGTALHSVWEPEINRFCTIEMKEWERIARHRRILRKVPDIHGGQIYTDEQMFTYMQQFEKDFADCSVRVIDATEGGALKQGTEVMTLAQATERYCKGPIDAECHGYRREIKEFNADRLAEARAKVVERKDAIEELANISAETLELVQEMLELIDDQPELNRKMIRLDELRTQVKHRSDTYRLVMYVSQLAELLRFRRDRMLDLDGLEGKDRQRRQLQRDVGYVSEIKVGCERLLEMLDECVERFDQEIRRQEENK